MFVYTVKLKIKEDLKNVFMQYLHKEHIPDVVSTGCFMSSSLEVDTINSNEMIARYTCNSQHIFDEYMEKYANIMRAKVMEKYPDAILSAERNFCKIV